MKIVNLGDRGSITMQHSYDVVANVGVNASLVGFQGDAIMLNLVDIGRLQLMNHEEIQRWLSEIQHHIKISFDPGVVK